MNLNNPATSGPMADPMPIYGSKINNPAHVHTSTDKRPGVPGGNKFQFNAFQPHFSKDPLKMANLNKAFLTGFCEKCAEHRISPLMLKQAIETVENQWYASPLANTAGRVLGSPIAALMGRTLAPFKEGPGTEDVKPMLDKVKGVDLEGFPLQVQLSGTNPLNNLARTWQHPKTNVLSKLWGTATLPIREILKSLTRADSYDPYAHSTSLFMNEPGVMAHELGHARDYARRDWPGAYGIARGIPGVDIYQELIASRQAAHTAKKMKLSPEETKRLQQLLGAGTGSYIGNLAGTLVGAPGVGGVIGSQVGHNHAGRPESGFNAEEIPLPPKHKSDKKNKD